MESLLTQFTIKINNSLYQKDPSSSTLGEQIVGSGIEMIKELGFEQFTFKKLAERIGTTEASIYRYFENKHKLLLYMVSWYWVLLEYRIVLETNNLPDPLEKIDKTIQCLFTPIKPLPQYDYISMDCLSEIIIEESSKVFLTRQVDHENEDGVFAVYKRICKRVAAFIDEYDSDYENSMSLVSSLFDIYLKQQFYLKHIPSLTSAQTKTELKTYIKELVFNTIKK